MKVNRATAQQGFVSIFTVLFFIIFITVITVGFLRIITGEQTQSVNNSLTASALQAARSGVEDGKRALLLYNNTTDAGLKSALAAAFASQSCTGIFGNPVVAGPLGLETSGAVASSTGLNQKYSCLIVSPLSPDYIDSSAAGQSKIVPLIGQSGFDSIKFSWHDTVQDKSLGAITTPVNKFPTQTAWNSAKTTNATTAYMRLELITTAAPGSITPSTTTSQVVYLIPASAGSAATFTSAQPNIAAVHCQISAASKYACNVTIPVAGGPTPNLYLRVTPLYGSTHFGVTLLSGGMPVNFNGVQPIIDSTGQASDVFRRIQARVSLTSDATLPEYALESGNNICKAFEVGKLVDTGNGLGAGCPVN